AAGQKTDAMLSLHQFRNYEILIYNLKKRQLYFQNCITRMETADITQTMVAALEEFNKVMEIDVNAISNVIDDLEMSNVDLDEMDSIMNTAFERETAGMEMKETENFPGVESLFDKLQGEAALEIGGGAKDIAPMSKSSINEIEAKLNSLNTSEK
ncbi:MAG: hypothetical protein IKS45_12605, partial [Thermoguttaceae bacterium]|nr:hypothetical protein [Thermoguttaceae bacterium]